MNKKATIEALKEVGRLALFAAISAVLTWAADVLAGLDPNSTTVVVGTIVLRFLDKWKYVQTKQARGVDTKGIAPF